MAKIELSSLKKLYYTIGEVSEMFDVNTSLIRFWEKEFPSIKPKKNAKGNRLFTVKDIGQIQKIYDLVKVNGYTLDGAKKALKSKKPIETAASNAEVNKEELIQRLESVRAKLLALRND